MFTAFILWLSLVAVVTVVLATRKQTRDKLEFGRAALEDGRVKVAERHFRKMIRAGRESAEQEEAYLGLGQALESLDRIREAAEVYQEYLDRYERTGRGTNQIIDEIWDRLDELHREAPERLGLVRQRERRRAVPVRRSEEPVIRLRESSTEPQITVREAGSSGTERRISLTPRAMTESEIAARPVLEQVEPGAAPVDQADRTAGRYLVGEKLGAGGFGEVYQAWLPVAIKFAHNPALVEHLRKLGTLQGKVKSDRVVAPIEVNLEADPPYVVMEHVDGPNMRVLLETESLRPSDAVALVREVALALKDAHDVGVLHLDLKPENVLLTRDGRIKLTDFELGRDQEEASRFRLSQSLVSVGEDATGGTVAYMSPEQRFGKTLDERSDIYTLGVMLFEALTGELPQPGDKPSDFIDSLPAEVDRIFERCFTRHERRYASSDKLLVDLATAQGLIGERPDLATLLARVTGGEGPVRVAFEPEGVVAEVVAPLPEPVVVGPEPRSAIPERESASESDPEAASPPREVPQEEAPLAEPDPEPARPSLDQLIAERAKRDEARVGPVAEASEPPPAPARPPIERLISERAARERAEEQARREAEPEVEPPQAGREGALEAGS